MKKSVVILTGILLLAGAMSAWAQAPFAGYKTEVKTEAYHSLGNDATVLWEPTAQDTLNRRIFLPENQRAQLSASETAKYPANIALGSQMPFGLNTFSSMALTADGFVFFGSRLQAGDEADSVLAAGNVMDISMMVSQEPGKSGYFLYSGFHTKNNLATPAYIESWLVGGQDAKIGYETAAGVMYICYENIGLCDADGGKITVSWNYQLELATGNINLQIKDFSSAAENKYRYLFGLFGTMKGFNDFDALWLKDWMGATVDYAYEDNMFSTDGEPTDKTFSFTVPAACQKISGFTVTWDDNFSTVTDNTVNIGASIDWNEGNKALFVFSKEQTLSGDNKPVDGVLYTDGAKLGTGEVRIGTKDQLGGEVNGVFENLEPSTTYYCHVFGYNDDCSGLVYSDPQTKSFTTLMGAPQTDVITMGSVTATSFNMTLAAPASGFSYVVAVSQEPLTDEEGNPLVELSKGTTYQEGNVVDGLATIKKVGIGAGEITIGGLESATPYYVAVWHMQGTGSSVEYSLNYVTVGQRTVTEVPVTIDFTNELYGGQPRGWTISKDETGVYGFEVSNYGSEDDGPGIAVSAMAKAPQAGSRILVCQLMYDPEEDNDLPQTKTMSAYAISPVFDTASFPEVTGILKVGFLKTSWGGFGDAYTLQASDSVIISWAANQTENWNRLYKIDRTTEFDEEGFATITTPTIRPNGNFRYKVEVFRTLNKNEETAEAFIIESLEVEEDLPCKYPTDIQVVESNLYATTAKLQWEDANLPATPSFAIAYRAQGEEDWNEKTTGEVELLLENLTPATTYDVRIQAVCGTENVSLEKNISFTTYGVIPYIWDPVALMEENPEADLEFLSDMKIYKGALDATLQQGAGWEMGSDRMGYPMMNLPLATQANTWLMLPALIAENTAEVNTTVNLANWGMPEYGEYENPQSQDTLWLFVSENGSFAAADRRVAGFVAMKDLLYAMDEIPDEEDPTWINHRQHFNEKTITFDVESGKKYSLAFFIPGIEADVTTDETTANNLSINKISVEYGTISYPAVTDIYTYDLGKTSVSIAWQGQADSYVVIYKPRSEEVFDTVVTEETHIELTGLQSGIRYEFYVYGIYDGIAGEKSAQRFFSTIAQCEMPTDFDVVQIFWDGAQITAKSNNTRLVHIKSEGELTDWFLNQVLEWTYRGDSLRIRGLHVGGEGYPYSVRVRAVCSFGDSSAWTEPITFRTAEFPEVGVPTNLRATFNSANRTATLSWIPGINNDYMYIYYKKNGHREYDDTIGTFTTSYILRDLENDVVYKWALRGLYEGALWGRITEGPEFGSGVGNENREYSEEVRVYVNDRQIIVDNPENCYIKAINVYDVAGRRLKSYPVNDRGNLFVNTDLKQGMVLIEVIGSASERTVSKAVIR